MLLEFLQDGTKDRMAGVQEEKAIEISDETE